MKPSIIVATLVLALGTAVVTQAQQAAQAPKPEQLIKWRQSLFQTVAWNSARIKANVEGSAYNKEEVVKSATVIAALANSGLGGLFGPGTETGKGWHDTLAKPELFSSGAKVGELAGDFNREAAELVKVAGTGDAAATKAQYGKLNRTCKACHDEFKNKE